MACHNPAAETELTIDPSPVGLKAVLTQKSPTPNEIDEVRIVSYASRALTDVEKSYSQTERRDLPLYRDVRCFIYICMTPPLTSIQTTSPWKLSSAILNLSLLPVFISTVEALIRTIIIVLC